MYKIRCVYSKNRKKSLNSFNHFADRAGPNKLSFIIVTRVLCYRKKPFTLLCMRCMHSLLYESDLCLDLSRFSNFSLLGLSIFVFSIAIP